MRPTVSALAVTDNAAQTLLQDAGLPVNDLGHHTLLFGLQANGQLLGTVGLEHDGETGLLRSLSVRADRRGDGHGKHLVAFLEAEARRLGVRTLYLLTTTAAPFFARQGYRPTNRSDAPPFIAQTAEFRSVCPASAAFLKKDLA